MGYPVQDQTPANTKLAGAQVDPDIDYFSAEYLMGERWPLDPPDEIPGSNPIVDSVPLSSGPQESWVGDAPITEPNPALATNPTGVGQIHYAWDGSAPLVVMLPNGGNIRSLYVPKNLGSVGIVIGTGGNNAVYTLTALNEVYPIQKGVSLLTLFSPAPFSSVQDIYATDEVLPPARVPQANQQNSKYLAAWNPTTGAYPSTPIPIPNVGATIEILNYTTLDLPAPVTGGILSFYDSSHALIVSLPLVTATPDGAGGYNNTIAQAYTIPSDAVSFSITGTSSDFGSTPIFLQWSVSP